jgi:hypothetical protein
LYTVNLSRNYLESKLFTVCFIETFAITKPMANDGNCHILLIQL